MGTYSRAIFFSVPDTLLFQYSSIPNPIIPIPDTPISIAQRIRETLTLALFALLPFHALLVTVGTKLILGPGHAPMGMLAVWKEGLLVFIVGIAVLEIIRGTGDLRIAPGKTDLFDRLILALILLSVFVTAMTHGDWKLFLFGFKYDFVPLAAFLILRRVPWSDGFLPRAEGTLLGVGVIVALYGIVTFFLPAGFFTWLGYSDLHSLYVPDGPLAAFQQIGGSSLRRIQSTMSGPNQLGLWLLIPWSVCIASLVRKNVTSLLRYFVLACIAIALLFTFSRSAWIGATIIALLGVGSLLPRMVFWRVTAALGALVLIIAVAVSLLVPSVFIRFSSSRDHYLRPMEAVRSIIAHPLGQGLGTAGPASNRVSDTCVFLDAGADATWAADRPDLCVFAGDIKVQPANRDCNCPFIPENWYLQIGVELGVLGLILYMALMLSILWRLHVLAFKAPVLSLVMHTGRLWVFLSFLAVCVAALFLHAWEDAAVAYTGWVLLSVIVLRTHRQ